MSITGSNQLAHVLSAVLSYSKTAAGGDTWAAGWLTVVAEGAQRVGLAVRPGQAEQHQLKAVQGACQAL